MRKHLPLKWQTVRLETNPQFVGIKTPSTRNHFLSVEDATASCILYLTPAPLRAMPFLPNSSSENQQKRQKKARRRKDKIYLAS